MVLPRRLAEEFQSRMSFYSCTVSNFEQYALMRFIREGYLEKHINRMRNYYHRQRDTLLHAIKQSPLSSCVMITEEDSGLHFLMKIDTGLSDTELTERARKKGLRLTAPVPVLSPAIRQCGAYLHHELFFSGNGTHPGKRSGDCISVWQNDEVLFLILCFLLPDQ